MYICIYVYMYVRILFYCYPARARGEAFGSICLQGLAHARREILKNQLTDKLTM